MFRDQLLLLAQFLKSPLNTAEILSSSKVLVRRIVAKIDFSNANIIVELGSGTGAVTKEILRHLPPSTNLLVFEHNPVFALNLKNKLNVHNNVEIIKDDAANLDKYTHCNADHIISGLPLLTMKRTSVETIVKKCYEQLKLNGRFIVYQSTLLYYRMLKKYFTINDVQHVWWNIPPYYIVTCRKTF